jgi:hypothetical protein
MSEEEMTYRAADILDHLRMKQNMVESYDDAVFSDGKRLPILIYDQSNGERKLVIEVGNQFYDLADRALERLREHDSEEEMKRMQESSARAAEYQALTHALAHKS